MVRQQPFQTMVFSKKMMISDEYGYAYEWNGTHMSNHIKYIFPQHTYNTIRPSDASMLQLSSHTNMDVKYHSTFQSLKVMDIDFRPLVLLFMSSPFY